jgi:hypothetical protein
VPAVDRPDPSDLAAIGPFFALSVRVPAPRSGPGASWRPAAALAGGGPAVREWVDWGAARLGTGDRVVAASLLYQGWAARMTSIFAGAVVLWSAAPDLGAGGLWYRYPPGGGAIDLAVASLDLSSPDVAWRLLVDDNLAPLGSALRGEVRVGRRLLWGNVASAMAGSLAALDRAGHGPLPDLVAAPWSHPPELAGLGSWTPTPAARELHFRRTTCCLYERLPGAARCGDCSLDP